MSGIIIHPVTKRLLEQYIARPAHGLLIGGTYGSGKFYLSQYLVSRLLGTSLEKVARYPHLLHILPNENGSISIDEIRSLYTFLKLKTPVHEKRFIIVEDSQGLTHEAQNAFLKILEEPPQDTFIIMTVTNPSALLPTIRSRLQTITVKTPLNRETLSSFAVSYDPKTVERNYHISGGQIGLMAALLGDKDHELIPYIEQAKQLITATAFERLILIDTYSKQKNHNAFMLLLGLSAVARAALAQALKRSNTDEVKRWVRIQRLLYACENSLHFKPQTKLMLTDLVMQM